MNRAIIKTWDSMFPCFLERGRFVYETLVKSVHLKEYNASTVYDRKYVANSTTL